MHQYVNSNTFVRIALARQAYQGKTQKKLWTWTQVYGSSNIHHNWPLFPGWNFQYEMVDGGLLYAKAVPAATCLLARLADTLYKGSKDEYIPYLDRDLRNDIDDIDAVLGSLLWTPSHDGYTSPAVTKRLMSMHSFSNLHIAFRMGEFI